MMASELRVPGSGPQLQRHLLWDTEAGTPPGFVSCANPAHHLHVFPLTGDWSSRCEGMKHEQEAFHDLLFLSSAANLGRAV